ncbi:capsule biosynthesis protein [Acidomonas methanolica]|uniref:capsule biosynthesis protein n=1 Tax=Acidomonas methanolica TaxID=437 RepID=UPI00211A14E2|nr:capsular biosynthesis protein [Acidomonas methanolica]MCQ9155613.1 capsular biosynthesis protein [Acidomonas methanolica]
MQQILPAETTSPVAEHLPQLPVRNFLFLQGLMGPFFERVGARLRRDGYGVYKVNFNGGDWWYWAHPGAINYRGDARQWPATLRRIIASRKITDVLLFGDCRPLHRTALEICKELHLPVHVFEEGYLRPDWVTLELGGVNGHSTLPRDPDYYLRTAAMLPPAGKHFPVPSSFRRRAFEGVIYNAADLLSRGIYFNNWTTHRPWHPVREGIGWLRKIGRGKGARSRSTALEAKLKTLDGRYVLFPLQLDADAQVRMHSDFADIAEAITTVISSFAAHAPVDLRLVIKEHPLDNGVKDWKGLVAEISARCGVAGRVDYMEAGDIAAIVCQARGVVTINSTTGTLSVACGVPTITLGRAVYNIDGITHQGSLDTFWTAPTPPDPAVFGAFQRVLVHSCLVPGGFFSDEALETLVSAAIERLERHAPIAHRARTAPSSASSHG